jgi:hypothetical protein
MARLADVSPGDLITSQRQNDINDYIEDGTEYLITKSAQLVGSATAPVDGDLAQGRLYADTSGNLHFYTGSVWKNISGGQTFDCVVAASGGDYTTVGAAITAGKTSIFVKDGTYTETGAITCPASCTIVGENSPILSMGTNQFTTGGGCYFQNLHFETSGTGHQIIIGGNDETFFNCNFTNLDTANPGSVSGIISDNNVARLRVRLISSRFSIGPVANDTPNRAAIHIDNTGSWHWEVRDCWFTHGSFLRGGYSIYTDSHYGIFTDLKFRLCGKLATDGIYINGEKNIINNFQLDNGNCQFDIEITSVANHTSVSNCPHWSNGVTWSIGAYLCQFSNVVVNNMTITKEANMFTSCSVGNVTMSGTVYDTMFSGCYFSSITDASTCFRNKFVGCGISNTGTTTINGYDYNFAGCSFTNAGAVSLASTAIKTLMNSCTIFNGLTTAADDVTITDCRVGVDAGGGSNTITISSGANRTIVANCRTDAAISDSGTSTSAANNVVY